MNALISEQDAHCLLTVPFRRSEKEMLAHAKKQEQALLQASKSWEALMAALKQACRAFCSRVEPEFEPFLQEVLLMSAKRWHTFPPWDHLFYFDRGSGSYTNLAIRRKSWSSPWLDRIGVLKHPREWIEKIITIFYTLYQALPHESKTGLFVRDLSGTEVANYVIKVREEICQDALCLDQLKTQIAGNLLWDKKGNYLQPSPELGLQNLEFLRNTPFYSRLKKQMSFELPLGPRKAHMWVCTASESGKTQLIQRTICDDIEHGRSVVIVDSQRDMIMEKLLWLKHDMEVVLIDPEDIEYPPGIALFDISFGTGREAEDREADVIQCYGDMFSVFGSELTGRQDSLLAPALRLMFTIPHANIYTLIDLFRGENMSRYIEKLPKEDRDFFFRDWTSPQYKANKQQILAKLNIIVQNKTIRRIFSNTERKFDFYSILNRPCVVLINTSRSLLKDKGCMLFGRFMLSQIIDAIRQRANIPERERMTTYIYVDEGKDYRDADAIINTVYECRKYGGHLIFCSQNYGQLGTNMASALFSSAIKFVRAVRETSETNKLADYIRIDKEEFRNLKYVDHHYSEWACQIRDEKAIKLRVDFGYLENQPKITEIEYQKLREENRKKYCVKAEDPGRAGGGSSNSSVPSDEPTSPRVSPGGIQPEKPKPADDDDYYA